MPSPDSRPTLPAGPVVARALRAVATALGSIVWLAGCSSSTGGSADAGGVSETMSDASHLPDAGSGEAAADAAAGDPCGALLSCCATIHDTGGNCQTGGCGVEGPCIIEAVSLQSVCSAALGPGGYCAPGSGDAGPAPCGPSCTRLGGCCGKLPTVEAGSLVPGCTALATTCTTGSESHCAFMLELMTGAIRSAGFSPLACP